MKNDKCYFFFLFCFFLTVAYLFETDYSIASEKKAPFPYASGTTIRMIVPYSPGGGYDVESRMTAPYIQKYLEEMGGVKINVIVENITGAAGAIATAQVFTGKTDGTILFMLDPESSIWQQKVQGAKFDITKFEYLGQRSADPMSFILSKEFINLKSFNELALTSMKKPLLLATCGFGGHDHMYPLLFKAFLEKNNIKINFDFLHTDGTALIVSHFRRGEIDGTIEIIRPFIELIDRKEARVLFTFTEKRTELLPDVPTIYELPEFASIDKKELNRLVNFGHYRRVMVAPPGTENTKVKILSEAVGRALKDRELINKSIEAKRPITYIDSQKIREIINEEMAIVEKYLSTIKTIMK